MGEFVQLDGERIKLGVCEDLNYTTYEQYRNAFAEGRLSPAAPNFKDPWIYAKPDSGYRFRFPFPDEDNLAMGYREDLDRGVTVSVDASFSKGKPFQTTPPIQSVVLSQQKLIIRSEDNSIVAATVIKVPDGRKFSVVREQDMKDLINNIINHHIVYETDLDKKKYFSDIAQRIFLGYRITTVLDQKRLPRKPGNGESNPGLRI